MFNSKYGNILTMILVILIVAILGILGYFAYGYFNSKSISNNANSAVEEFKHATTTIKKDTSDKNSSSKKENTVGNTTAIDSTALLELLNQSSTEQQQEPTTETEEPEKVMMDGYEVMGTIKIPKTGIELPVLESVTKKSLELSVGIAYGPGLNEHGNTIIFGHNYRNGLFFSDNKKLVNGDVVYITDKYNNTVTYVIYNIYETTPDDASYMQRQVEEGVREISLQTCTDDSSGRIIIWAKEQ